MTQWAIVSNSCVAQIVTSDEPPSVLNGQAQIVDLTGASPMPSIGWYYFSSQFWRVPNDLTTAKAVLHQRVNENRDAAMAAGITLFSHDWDTDEISRGKIATVATSILSGEKTYPGGIYWTDASDVDQLLTETQFLELAAGVVDLVEDVHTVARVLKTDIAALTTIQDAHDFDTSITSRPAMSASWNKTTITADGVDTATFGSGIPSGTKVDCISFPQTVTPPSQETITTGSFSFAADVVGEYVIQISPPLPYHPVVTTITAQ